MMTMLVDDVGRTLEKYGMLKKHDKVLVCISGGPDSVALLHILNQLSERLDLKLHLAHLNHMLRGAESQRDMEFVKNSAKKLSVPIALGLIDVKKEAKNLGLSLEDGARQIRYKFFTNIAGQLGIKKIATAHTRDDQAETVLMRLIKGSGLLGLSGIPPLRQHGDFTIIRPMIEISRKDVLEYLEVNKISFRTDSSNMDRVFLRNKIRLDLLPYLEEFNPNVKEVLCNFAMLSSSDHAFIRNKASDLWPKISGAKEENKISFAISEFLKLEEPLQKELFRQAVFRLKGDLNKITYKNWEEFDGLVKVGHSGRRIDLPGQLLAALEHGRIVLIKKNGVNKAERKVMPMRVPGHTRLDDFGGSIISEILPRSRFKKTEDKAVEYFDMDKIKDSIFIRARLPGDRIRPIGMKEYKKLQDVFVDEKVPFTQRDKIPLLVAGNEVIWACSVKISDVAKVTRSTKRVLKLRYQRAGA